MVRDEERDLGGDASCRSAVTAAAGDVGTGRVDGAWRSSRAGRGGWFLFHRNNPTAGVEEGFLNNSRAVSPMTQAGDGLQAESVEQNDSSTMSSESSDSDSSSRDGSDASSSDDGTPTPTAARTAARQLGAHMSEPGD